MEAGGAGRVEISYCLQIPDVYRYYPIFLVPHAMNYLCPIIKDE